MRILGIGGSTHDFSCCLLEDGKIIRAIEEERITREKHGDGIKSLEMNCIKYCLGDYTMDDINLVAVTDIFRETIFKYHKELWNYVKLNHHMAHAASSYFTSGFDEAAIMVLDGIGGNGEGLTLGYAKGNDIKTTDKFFGKSLAKFYSHFMYMCGFDFLQEGKLMGLAPYGKDTYVEEMFKFVEIDLPDTVTVHIYKDELMTHFEELVKADTRDEFEVRADIAYAVQHVFEESLIEILNYLYEKTKSKKLCYAGGAALNSVLNGKIIDRTPFEEVYVFPAAGDSGVGIGAALYAYYNLCGCEQYKGKRLQSCFYGKTYSQEEILCNLKQHSDELSYLLLNDSDLYAKTAKHISEGRIIGWYQDGAETGPRALGNRSILADPRKAEMKDILNKRVKFREHFRPFAPMVKKEQVKEYFEGINDNSFMLFVEQVNEDKRDVIPAVTHVDGSARLQTVSEENNQKMYRLLSAFEEKTGVPVILNTSFNIKGQPIVETPADAIDAFIHCDMDVLVMDHFMVLKIDGGLSFD